MSTLNTTNEDKCSRLVKLVEEFCEIVFFQKNKRYLSEICREDISFYSNLVSGIGHGLLALEEFRLHALAKIQPAEINSIGMRSIDSAKYEIIEASVYPEGAKSVEKTVQGGHCACVICCGHVVLKFSAFDGKAFHIIADLIKESKDGQEGDKLLISKIHIFYESNEQQHTSKQENKNAHSNNIVSTASAIPNVNPYGGENGTGFSGVIACYAEDNYPVYAVDERMLKHLGYNDVSEIQSEGNGIDFLHPDSAEKEIQDLQQQLEKGNEFALEFRLRIKNGTYMWISATGTRTVNAEGREIIVFNCVDMKQQQAMLASAVKEIRQLYNNIPGAIMRCAHDFEGNVEFANDGFYRLIDYTREEFSELFQNKMSNLIHPEDELRVRNILANFTNHRDILSLDHRIISKTGKRKWISVHATVIINEKGNSSLYCTCIDITERHEMLADLTFTKEKMEAAIQHTGLHYWDYYPIEDKANIHENFGQKSKSVIIENFPESVIETGAINENSIDVFRSLHARVKAGESYVEGTILSEYDGKEEWRKVCYTNIFDSEGYPSVAIGTSENIDDYKEIERRLAIAAVQTGLDIWTYNIDSKIITQEDNVATIGLSERYFENVPEAVIESGIIYEEDVEKYLDVYRQLNSGVMHVNCELRVKSTNTDNFKWTKLSYTVLGSGESARTALGIAIDISEQKLAETYYEDEIRLWDSEANDAAMACIVNISSDMVLNGKADEALGIEVMDFSAQSLFDLFFIHILGVEDQNSYTELFTVENLVQQFNQGGRSHSLELQVILESLETIWVSLSIKMMKNPVSNDIIGFIIMDDITETKISQKFVEELVNHQFDFILRLNYMSNTYKLFASEPIRAVLNHVECGGVYSEDIVSLLGGTVVEDDLELLLNEAKIERILERSANEGDYYVLFRAKRVGSGDRFKRIHVFLKDEETNSIYMGCVDITEMHLQEQQRVEALRGALTVARQANESKSMFLASMSHDIRTPMNAIIGMTNLAMEDQKNTAQVAESLSVIKSSSEHLLSLLNDILEMSRLESGKVVFSKESFSISYECGQVYNFFKGIVIQKEQKLSFECIDIKHDQVISDVTRFNRVLTNLLGNAVKFTPNGGEISMNVEELEMENEKTALFRITIKDSGIGIAKEHLSSIFEAFNREQKSTVRQIEGTGLGLAIVKSLVDGQGGSINVESDTGKGATFIVELPMTIDEEIVAKKDYNIPALQMKDVDLKSKHVLLVEDHPVNIIVATKMLEKMGAVISVANNGKEGYDKFYNSPVGTFQLVLMDLQMPIMNGHEATVAIRESDHPEAKTIPIVAMTANAFAEDVRSCKASGMNCHIAKPITVENILTCLTQLRLI